MDRFTVLASAVAGALLVAIVWGASAPSSTAQASSPQPRASELPPGPAPADPDPIPAPDFELPIRSGETFRLSDHRGEVVLLNLWATWCPPCQREMPDFEDLYQAYGADGFTVVGVALDEGGWDAVGPFVDRLGVTYPVVVDDGRVDARYGPTASFPTSFLIDRQGNVRHYLPGMILRPDLEPLVRDLLTEPAP